MSDTLTIYAVFFDMEQDMPDAYCLAEEIAQLLAKDDTADYVELQVSEQEYMALLTGRK